MEKSNNWIWVFLIILSIWFWKDHRNLTNQVEILKDEVADLDYKMRTYSSALDQANSNIEDAKWYAWSSYDDMGYALDSLEIVEP